MPSPKAALPLWPCLNAMQPLPDMPLVYPPAIHPVCTPNLAQWPSAVNLFSTFDPSKFDPLTPRAPLLDRSTSLDARRGRHSSGPGSETGIRVQHPFIQPAKGNQQANLLVMLCLGSPGIILLFQTTNDRPLHGQIKPAISLKYLRL